MIDIGKVVAGRFHLLAEAGSGGMGTVYQARDLTDGATVAVKLLTGQEVREAARFEQEAAILSGLTHPAIVRYLTSGIAESGQRFIAMEWLDGEDLAMRLDRKPVTVAEAVAVARRAAEALAYAHGRGKLGTISRARGASCKSSFASSAVASSASNTARPVRHWNSTQPSENTSAPGVTSRSPRTSSGAM